MKNAKDFSAGAPTRDGYLKSIIALLLCVIMLLSISACGTGKTDAGSETDGFTNSDFKGMYICRGEIYEKFISDSEEYIPYISFDGNGACTARIYYIGGLTYVPGTYSVSGNTMAVDFDLTYSAVWDPKGEMQELYMGESYTFSITDKEHINIKNGFYAVDDGDLFEKISDEPQRLPEASEFKSYMGIYYCRSGSYADADIKDDTVPYVYIAKEGLCCLHIKSAGGDYGRDTWGAYSLEDGKIRISELKFQYEEDKDPDSNNIPHEYVFEITDENTLTIDRGFYNVSAGDVFVRGQ